MDQTAFLEVLDAIESGDLTNIDLTKLPKEVALRLNRIIKGYSITQQRQIKNEERLQAIAEAALSLTVGDHSAVLEITEAGDEIDAISMAFNTLNEELQASGRVIQGFEQRINTILEILLQYTDLNFEDSIPISDTGDELDAIAIGLNAMSEELQSYINQLNEAQTELKNINANLEHLVELRTEELAIANNTLHQSNESLRKTNEDLDAFIYATSHDLKVPITNFEGLLGMLKTMLPQDNPILPSIVEKMDTSVVNVKKTIRSLEQAAQTQKATYTDYQNIDIEHLLGDIKTDLNDIIHQTGASIHTDLGPNSNTINYSKDAMNSIMNHLLSNAILYHKPDVKPEVDITTFCEDDYVVLSIADNGLGIDLDKHEEKLFAIFKRLHDHVEGDGVGLNLIKRIVENHDGKIVVESELNKGSTFKVYFKNEQKLT